MCIVLFTTSVCACPPTPTYPYLRLCASAKQQEQTPKACPPGRRLSHVLGLKGECAWCRQCKREKAREERREWVRGVVVAKGEEERHGGRGGRGGGGRGRGRFVRW